MENLILSDVAEFGNTLQKPKGLNSNFKKIQQSKSSQKSHLKDLGTESKVTKAFGYEVGMGTEK